MPQDIRILPRPKLIKINENVGIPLTESINAYINDPDLNEITKSLTTSINITNLNNIRICEIENPDLNIDKNMCNYFCCILDEKKYNSIFQGNIKRHIKRLSSIRDKEFLNLLHDYDQDCIDTENIINLWESEGYIIEIHYDIIWLIARSIQGYYYGIQTLIQMFKTAIITRNKNELLTTLPDLFILDFADIRLRGFHLDLKKQMPTINYIKQMIRELGHFKYNVLLMEYEDKFDYKGLLQSGVHKYKITEEEHQEIVNLCKSNFIEIIPFIQTFGHLETWLQKKEFEKYGELFDIIKKNNKNTTQNKLSKTICPLKKESEKFIFEFVDQICRNHPNSQYVHIGCDEVRELGTCNRCKSFVEENSKSELYIQWINQIAERILRHNKIPIIWSDYLIRYPQSIEKLNKNIVVMYWDYECIKNREEYLWLDKLIYGEDILNKMDKELLEYHHKFYQTSRFPNEIEMLPFYNFFKDQELEVIGAPSLACCGRYFIPDHDQGLKNVAAQSLKAYKTDSLGISVTSWAVRFNPLDSQKILLFLSGDILWNISRIFWSEDSHEPVFNFDYYLDAISTQIFSINKRKNKLNLQMLFNATRYPSRRIQRLDYETFVNRINNTVEHLKIIRESAITNTHIIHILIFGLQYRKRYFQYLDGVDYLLHKVKSFEENEDTKLISNDQRLKEIAEVFTKFTLFHDHFEDLLNTYLVTENKNIRPEEYDVVFGDTSHRATKFLHKGQKIGNLLKKLIHISQKMQREIHASSKELDELEDYGEFEEKLFQMSKELFGF
ncbi:MAG: family 20 glycosylhydrolase [Candidatus Lokiarchaeota archaeon]|nr:family 20 glycosylhydrolase [Candidatus Lokiarchaeota archaeon]